MNFPNEYVYISLFADDSDASTDIPYDFGAESSNEFGEGVFEFVVSSS